MQLNTKINEVQKAIGQKKKAKENADDLLAKKIDLEKEKKSFIDSAAEKDAVLKEKLGTIGNLVHESVPVEQNEVCDNTHIGKCDLELSLMRHDVGFQCHPARMETRRCNGRKARCPLPPRSPHTPRRLRSRTRCQSRRSQRLLPQEMGCILKSSTYQLRSRVPRLKGIYSITNTTIYAEGVHGEDGAVVPIR